MLLDFNVSDLFKVSLFDTIGACSISDALISIGFALLLGLLISFVYTKTFKGVLYSKSFSISLVALSMITSLIVISVTSLAISLSMLGAMSIIRFRTAVKDPLDIVYLFWSIGVGIVIGAGLITIAVIGSLIIAVILFLCVNGKTGDTPYIVVVDCANSVAAKTASMLIRKNVKKCLLKSRTVTPEKTELTFEVRIAKGSAEFVSALQEIDGVTKATLVSYNGEYFG